MEEEINHLHEFHPSSIGGQTIKTKIRIYTFYLSAMMLVLGRSAPVPAESVAAHAVLSVVSSSLEILRRS